MDESQQVLYAGVDLIRLRIIEIDELARYIKEECFRSCDPPLLNELRCAIYCPLPSYTQFFLATHAWLGRVVERVIEIRLDSSNPMESSS